MSNFPAAASVAGAWSLIACRAPPPPVQYVHSCSVPRTKAPWALLKKGRTSSVQISSRASRCAGFVSRMNAAARVTMTVSEEHAEEVTQEASQEEIVPDRHMPAPPPGWIEKKKGQREEEVRQKGGVRIRRRPPGGPKSHRVLGEFKFVIEDDDNIPINILEEIVWNKDSEVDKMKETMPLPLVLQALRSSDVMPPRDFVRVLKARALESGVPALIAEVKKASPSRGVIQPDFDPVRIAKAYEAGGAACLSVLTDAKYFQGSFENLLLIRRSGVECPLLCKEFIVDAWQLYYARLHGADAVLLIAAVLPDQDLKYMLKIVHSLAMVALVEVHSEEEMERVLRLEGVQMIGINNRDLGTFKVDISNTEALLSGAHGEEIKRRGVLVVGESGLFTPADIQRVQHAGCSAVLVGESIVKESDPAAGIAALFGRSIAKTQAAAAPVADRVGP